jgi:hypothetical protein
MRMVNYVSALSLLLLLCLTCAAQEPLPTPDPELEELPTKLEALLEKTGAVIVKGSTSVGSVTGLGGTAHITSWEILDVSSGRKEHGVSVEIRGTMRTDRQETSDLAYVDYDELGPLIAGLNYLLRLDNTATNLSRFEAQYRTKGYLSFFRFNTPNGFGTAVSAGGRRGPRLILRPTGLVELRDLLESARALIDEARQKR